MIGRIVAHYKILRKLGEGGMGVVYLAEDTTLDRRVALKVLPKELADSRERLERFQREAKALAALDHSAIVTIHSVEEADGLRFLTMAYVDGKPLDRLIPPGGLRLEHLLELAVSLADGLRVAHERGIVHRDLKPGNIMVDTEGRLRILDFGLAKLQEERPSALSSQLATEKMEPPTTRAGTILGTYPYMSPEQAEGKAADARSDIFSLGVVLYEMATGRRPFRGATPVSLLSSILKDTPRPVVEERPEAPRLGALIERCLEKSPDRRFQSVAEVRAVLDELRTEVTAERLAVSNAAGRRRSPILWRALAALAAAAALTAVALLVAGRFPAARRSSVAPERAWQQITFFPDSAVSPALSPDGRMLAFLRGPSTFSAPAEVYVKLLPAGDPVPLTRDGLAKMSPVFSPDGARIAYTTVEQRDWDTWIVPVLGDEPRPWLPNASGLTWTEPGQILFSEITSGVHMGLVAARESRAEKRFIYLPKHERGMAHRSSISPDRQWVLAAEMETGAWLPCRLLPYDASDAGRPVGPEGACTHADWSPDGRWMYFTANAGDGFHLWRQRFPAGAPEQLSGGPTHEEGLAVDPEGRFLLTSVGSRQSAIVVATPRGEQRIAVEGYAWLDQSPHHGFPQPFSADGTRLFFQWRRTPKEDAVQGEESGELWVADLVTQRTEPVLPGVEVRSYTLSPDGRSLAAEGLGADGSSTVWLATIDRRDPPVELPLEGADSIRFAADGGIYFRRSDTEGSFIWYRSPDGELQRVLDTPILDFHGVSPDGRWLIVALRSEQGVPVFAFPVPQGEPLALCEACAMGWSPGGKFASFFFSDTGWHTLLVSLSEGETLPPLPEKGMTMAEVASLPGFVWQKEGLVYAGLDPRTYAYSLGTVQRNIFRIPVP